MSGEDHPQVGVHQVIQGEGHQVAGNDIHNHTRVNEYEPPKESPYLRPCRACGWPGVAVNASECGKCGYNYALERARAVEHQRRETELFVYWLGVAALVVFVGAIVLMHSISLGFFDAIAVSAAGILAAWGGWIWLSTWCSVKFNRFLRSRL